MIKGIKKSISDAKEQFELNNKNKKDEKISQAVEKKKKEFNQQRDKEIQKLKDTETYQTSFKTNKEYRAYVVLRIVSGTLSEEIAVLGAEIGYKDDKPVLRVKDRDGHIIFEENKPDAIEEFKHIDENTVDKQIQKCEKALKELQGGDKKEVDGLYESDWLVILRKFKAEKSHILLGEKGSYYTLRGGVPHYLFDLVGYFKIPVYDYNSRSTIAIPPLDKIITGQILMQKIQNEMNADEKDAQKALNTLLSIVIIISLIGSMILLFKSGSTDAEISQNLANATGNLKDIMMQGDKIDVIDSKLTSINQSLSELDPEPTKNNVVPVR